MIPKAFHLPSVSTTRDQYLNWVDDITNRIAENLWPRFFADTGQWCGNSARHALQLTIADLSLMEELREKLTSPITSRAKSTASHLELFLEEDGAITRMIGNYPTISSPGDSYEKYDNALPADLLKKVRLNLSTEVVGGLDLQLKSHLQRPRAYQMAYMLGRRTFEYEWARTAVSPSMISGHCLQWIMATCNAYVRLKDELQQIEGATHLLRQFAVDVGDRRVFAGVHYPSDNIGSWYVALRLASCVFGLQATDARAFLKEAIEANSAVYASLVRHVTAKPYSPFSVPLHWLNQELMAT